MKGVPSSCVLFRQKFEELRFHAISPVEPGAGDAAANPDLEDQDDQVSEQKEDSAPAETKESPR